ncbi:hypothetical protein ACMA1D_01815 [Streptomyces sp. 796.1]|uniref:hypothetical protein n=1 Tax=Streptomyces sp. 796.1 TaxID=3163029 RepID=UPI0039C8FE2A
MSFEIRIICDPEDVERVTAAMAATFVTGPARDYPSRDGIRRMLYLNGELADGSAAVD